MGKRAKPVLLLRSLLVSYIVTALLLLLLAFVLYKWRPGQQVMVVGVHGIYILACFLGGLFMGKGAGSRRFLWGMLSGALYFGILLLMTLTSDKGNTDALFRTLVTLALCSASGGIGATLG